MKKLIYSILLLSIPALSFAQDTGIYDQPDKDQNDETEKKEMYIAKTYLGPSIGINNISGMIGFLAEVNIVKNVTLTGGLGMGAWGYKASLGGRYYRNYPKGIFYGLGISTATGGKEVEVDLNVEPDNRKETVKMDLDQVFNVNLSLGYQFRLGKRARFNFEVGYSVPLQDEPYKVSNSNSNFVLSSDGKKAMDFSTPGGLILGIAFTFGI